MKNIKCHFTEAESLVLINKCRNYVGKRFNSLDDNLQHDLAMDAYTYLCRYHDFQKSYKPAFRSAVHHMSVVTGIVQGKSRLQIKLENKAKKAELSVKETELLEDLKAARNVTLVSMDSMIDDFGYDEKFGVTADAETLLIKADGVRRIKRAIAGRPLSEKAAELVFEGYSIPEAAEMLGVQYRTLLYNFEGKCNTPLPEPAIVEPVVEAQIPLVTVPVAPVQFKMYFEPPKAKKSVKAKFEHPMLDFGSYVFMSKQDCLNRNHYEGRR